MLDSELDSYISSEEVFLLSLYDRDSVNKDEIRATPLSNLVEGNWSLQISENESNIKNALKNPASVDDSSEAFLNILCSGISCLNAFYDVNWTGRIEISDIRLLECVQKFDVDVSNVFYDEDILASIRSLELLSLALSLFECLSTKFNRLCVIWWKLRTYYTIQKVLDGNSHSLFSDIEATIQTLSKFDKKLHSHPELLVKLNLEICQIYLMYRRVHKSNIYLENAKQAAQISLQLKGVLGKRTKFQQTAIAQLTIESKIEQNEWKSPAVETHGNTILPVSVKLDDDLRLETVKFENPDECQSVTLTTLEQLICLVSAQYVQMSQPKDTLSDDEILPYLTLLLNHQFGAWAVRIHTFLIKCKLESNHKRTVERSMMQCEEIVNSLKNNQPKEPNRLSYIWTSGLPPYVKWRSLLADLLLSIGLVKAALEIYLELQLWEEVIVCYTILELPHKAAEIIKNQIEDKPTAKLYCLLGDATDDPTLYETAWEFSKQKSSRAQRHWGNYLYSHKKYAEAIPHYEKSLEINSLQEFIWLRLGYAALSTDNWDIAANAYRRYTYLEPHSFEAWNNLAKVYVKQGNKVRAHKALTEALKFNYDSWQIWENMVLVSLDTGHFDDVIRGYHRLLDLKNKYLDTEVLSLLVKAIINDTLGADKNGSKRLTSKALELFSRVTFAHQNDATLWELYADISPTPHLRAQRLLNCYRATTHTKNNWLTDPEICGKILEIVEDLSKNAVLSVEESKASSDSIALLSSARLTLQGVVRSVEKQNWTQFEEKLISLQELLEKLTTVLKTHI